MKVKMTVKDGDNTLIVLTGKKPVNNMFSPIYDRHQVEDIQMFLKQVMGYDVKIQVCP